MALDAHVHTHLSLLSRYAVGVLDKASGVMRYAEAGTGNIVRMEPRARGVNYGPTGARTEHEDDRQARVLQNKKCAKHSSILCLFQALYLLCHQDSFVVSRGDLRRESCPSYWTA